MGVIDRPIRRLPSHPPSPKLKEVPKVLPPATSVSVHPLLTGHGSSGVYNDCKRSEADSPDKGNQTAPVPGRLANRA